MKTRTCGIYKITSITNKIYIGQSVNIEGRWKGHKKYLGKGQPRLHKSIKKHGIENHTFEIIEECIQELLNERETHWIIHFDTFNTEHGLNLTRGGDSRDHSEETKKKMRKPKSEEGRKNMSKGQQGSKKSEKTVKKMSLTKKGNKYASGSKRTEEHLKIIRDSNIGNKNALGYRLTEEQLKSRKNKRKPMSEQAKKKLMGNTNAQGYKFTEEQLRNHSEGQKGNTNGSGNKNKKQSPELLANRLKTMQENKRLKQDTERKSDSI